MDPAWYSYLPPSIPRVSLLDVFGAGIFPDDKRMPLLTDWPRHPYWLSVDDAHARASAMKLLE